VAGPGRSMTAGSPPAASRAGCRCSPSTSGTSPTSPSRTGWCSSAP